MAAARTVLAPGGMRHKCLLMILTVLVLGAIGCGSDPAARRPARYARGPSISPDRISASAPAPKAAESLEIDERIAAACAIPSAQFPFHADRIGKDARAVLDAVAECFASGPLKGRRMAVVSPADPRGQAAKELALGNKRAGSVAEYIERRGVESSKIATTSGDAPEASGEDGAGLPKERRVQILLVD